MVEPKTPHMAAIRKATEYFGGLKNTADALGIAKSLVADAQRGVRQLGPENCLRLARLTNGHVKARDLRPEIDWEASNL